MKLYEIRQLQQQEGIDALVNEVAFFITMNISKIQSYAKDEPSRHELEQMQQHLRQPVINGKTFTELSNEPSFYKHPKVAPHVLKYIYNLIRYVKPRLERFLRDDAKSGFIKRIDQITSMYSSYIKRISTS